MYATLWSVAVCSNKVDLHTLSAEKLVETINKRNLTALKVVNQKTFHAMQVEYPYIQSIKDQNKNAPILRDGFSFDKE